MKKAIIEGICCEGCARDIVHILNGIYGISNVKVSVEDCSATYEGFVSQEVIRTALASEGYRLITIEKIE